MTALELLEKNGFELWETGGGCTANRKELPMGFEMLLTVEEDPLAITDEPHGHTLIQIGIYDEEGQPVKYTTLPWAMVREHLERGLK